VLLDGRQAGTLTVSAEGDKVLFDAFCPGTTALVRLSAWGAGQELYLGVMQPEGGGLRLRRALRRREIPFSPEKLTHASRRGEDAARSIPSAEPDTLWRADALGMLWTETDRDALCAVPKRLGIARRGEELPERVIGGEAYRIFKIGKKRRP